MGLPNTAPSSVLDRIHQCLDKDPDRRPFPPSEVLKLFWEPLEEPRSSTGGWGATVLLLLLLAGGWLGFRAYRQSDQPEQSPAAPQQRQAANSTPRPGNAPPTIPAAAPPAATTAKPVPKGRLYLAAASDLSESSFSSEIRSQASQQVVRERTRWTPVRGRTVEDLPVGEYEVSMDCSSGRPGDPPSVLRQRAVVATNAEVVAVFDFRYVGITIQTIPPGASVSFTNNGIPYEEITPTTHSQVTPGFREFRFSLEGYDVLKTNIMVPGGLKGKFPIQVALRLRLPPETGKDWALSSLDDPLFAFRWIESFWAGVHEITRRQFAVFVSDTGHPATNGLVGVTADGWKFLPDHSWRNPGFQQTGYQQTEDDPVVGVSWDEAKAFCDWLTRRDRERGRLRPGQLYRLPTNAEFDRMTAGLDIGVGSGNFAGKEVLGGAWNPYWQTLIDDRGNLHVDSYVRTAPVGKTPGCVSPRHRLCDLQGNVAEWGAEWYTASMNPAEILREIPLLNEDGGGGAYRVVHGSSWYTEQMCDLAPAIRWRFPAGERHDFVGFRLVLVNEPTSAAPPQ